MSVRCLQGGGGVLPAPEGLQVPRAHREAGPTDSILAGLLRAVDLEPSWGLRQDSCNSMQFINRWAIMTQAGA